jgi:hypothetical protein
VLVFCVSFESVFRFIGVCECVLVYDLKAMRVKPLLSLLIILTSHSMEYYMPETPDTVPTDMEAVVNTGDGLDTGDAVALWTEISLGNASLNGPTAVCGTCATIVLGAATLAIYSATFAFTF